MPGSDKTRVSNPAKNFHYWGEKTGSERACDPCHMNAALGFFLSVLGK